MDKAEKIKSEILNDCHDSNYRNASILDIYWKNQDYLRSKLKSTPLSQESMDFLTNNIQRIKEIHSSVTIDFFRQSKIEELIEQFCTEPVDSNQRRNILKQNVVKKNYMVKQQEKTIPAYSKVTHNHNYKRIKYDIYSLKDINSFECPMCRKNISKMAHFISKNTEYSYCNKCVLKCIDILIRGNKNPIKREVNEEKKEKQKLREEKKEQKKKENNNKLIIALAKQTENGTMKWCVKKESEDFMIFVLQENSTNQGLHIQKKYTNAGFIYLVSDNDKSIMKYSHLDPLEKAIWNSNPEIRSIKRKVKTAEEIEQEKLQKKEEQKEKQKALMKKKEQERARKKEIALENTRKQEEKKQEEKKRKQEAEEKKRQELLKLPQIEVKDFVVKRSVFQCMHVKHTLNSIVAAIGVIDKFGKEQLVKVNAGYCEQCEIYFILESSYEKLKIFGIPMCRVSDEKTYMKNYSVNGMLLAQQSILMQYGYNVNQEEGLSQTRRQKILAVLIDKSILGKSEIISYLDFFISQRQYQYKYQVAISKWEADREFVENYRFGEYHQYGVNAIYRR